MAITVTGFGTTWTADYNVTGLDTAKRYDLVRILDKSQDSERRYSVVGWRRDWQPASSSVWLRDYQAPLRPYRVALYDSSLQTPIDWLFQTGPYAGPAPLQTSDLITLPAQVGCRAIVRSSVQPELFAQARLAGSAEVQYPARFGEHRVIGSKFPVFVLDRRQGRQSEGLIFFTPDAYQSELMRQVLLPDTGRIYPLWLRTVDDDGTLFGDLYFIPRDIAVEPVSKARPAAKWWSVAFTELDPRSIVPRQFPDGLTSAAMPQARISASTKSGKAPLTVTFTDASTGGQVDSRRWDLNMENGKHGTDTSQVLTFTYKTPGTRQVRLTVKGPGGTSSDEISVRVT